MGPERVEDTTRVVVDQRHRGGVIPGNRSEMWRDVFLVPGAAVEGPVWADRLQVEGPRVSIGESVYARGGILVERDEEVTPDTDDAVTFESSVTTPESLTVRNTGFRTRIRSNVYAGTVHLENCVVYGNLYADRAVVRNSLVLGGVYSGGELSVEGSVLATFDVAAAEIGPGTSLLFPVALTTQAPDLDHPVRVLCFYNLAELMEGVDDVHGGTVALGPDDIHPIDLPDRSDREGRETVHALTLNRRLLDVHDLEANLRTNRKVLEELALLDHLPEDRLRDWEGDAVLQMEETLLALAAGGEDLPGLEGRTGVDAVAAREDVRATLEMMHELKVSSGERGTTPGAARFEAPDDHESERESEAKRDEAPERPVPPPPDADGL